MRQRQSIILLVCLLLVLSGVVGYALLQTFGPALSGTKSKAQNESIGWQQYANTRAGYSFEYPAGGKYKPEEIGYAQQPNISRVVLAIDDFHTYFIETDFQVGHRSLEAWIHDPTVPKFDSDLSAYTKTTLAGQPAYFHKTGNGFRKLFYTMKNGNSYAVYAEYDDGQNLPPEKRNDPVWNRLIASFKLLP